MPEKHVYSVIIDSCHLSDESIARILEGIVAQSGAAKVSDRLLIRKLIYSYNCLGTRTLLLLKRMMPSLDELTINGVTNNLSGSLLSELLELIEMRGYRLQKLKLSNIDLSNELLVETYLLRMLARQSMVLFSLDLSWNKLSPNSLAKIVE